MTRREEAVALGELIGSVASLEEGLRAIASRLGGLGLRHVAYMQLGAPGPGRSELDPAEVRASATYDLEWQQLYRDRNYLAIDPVVVGTRRSLVPVDWCRLDRRDPAVERFFGASREYRVGRCGLSFPLHSPSGRFAVLSINGDATDREWELRRRELTMCFLFAAASLQARVEATTEKGETVAAETLLLSSLESDCLRFLAAGRSVAAIENCCRASPGEIRASLDSARRKLDACDDLQAAARAIGLGLITAD